MNPSLSDSMRDRRAEPPRPDRERDPRPAVPCEEEGRTAIVRIEPQKGSLSRFSVFTREGFLMGVSTDCMVAFGIHAGMQATPDQILQWKAHEQRSRLMERALSLLARRDHAEKELTDKLSRPSRRPGKRQVPGHDDPPDPGMVRAVILELRERNLICDKRFATRFIQEASERRGWGEVKIRAALQAKGVEPSIGARLVQAYAERNADGVLEQACRSLEQKKWYFSRFQDQKDRRERMGRFLQRKGFKAETVRTALRRCTNQADV